LYAQLKRYDEAVGSFDEALRLNPKLVGAWLGRGNIFTDRDRYDEGLGRL